MGRDYSRDPDSSPFDQPKWWDLIGESQKPSPYATASWAFFQTSVVEDTCGETEEGTFECDTDTLWWETLGGTLRPYASASWSYFQESDIILESFITTIFEFFDDGEFPDDQDKDLVIDEGLFNGTQASLEVIDEEEWNAGGDRVVMVKRTFAEISVYDTHASSPGNVADIAEPLGDLVTDPANPLDFVKTDEVPESRFLQLERTAEPGDDRPPGTLLGKISYEIFGAVAKITSWTHYNWEDDEPIRKACEVLIRELPDCVTEVVVEDDPTAFWTSLGFKQVVKGEPLLHFYR